MSDLFSAGTRVAFHAHPRGRYRGGLAGVDARFVGREAMHLRVCLARVETVAIRGLRAITHRHGTRGELLARPT